MAIPVHIVGGFLGTGKTTAIRAQLEARRHERVGIIVNDFGDAGLDEAALAEGEPYRIANVPGGCICCSAPEHFAEALAAVLDTAPDRLFVEPTGLARPQDLVDAMRLGPARHRIDLRPVLVLVNPAEIDADTLAALPLLEEQARAADIVVANRIDLATPEEIERFHAWVRGFWPEPLAVHATSFGRLPDEVLDWPAGEGPRAAQSAVARADPVPGAARSAATLSTEGFRRRSWCWPPEVVFSQERLVAALARLATGRSGAELVRFKGIFRTQAGVHRLEVAGGRVDDRPSEHRRDSRLDVIVRAGDESPLDRVAEWLEAAVLAGNEG